MGRRVSDGQSVKVPVPASTNIVQGDFYDLSGFFGMAMSSVVTAAGEVGEVALMLDEAEYETSQINALDAFAFGDDVWWDPAANVFRSSAHGAAAPVVGAQRVGRVTIAKDANNVIWWKRSTQDNL